MTWHDVDDRMLLAFAVAAGPHTLSLAALIAEFARTIAAKDDPRAANAIAGTDCLELIVHDPELLPGIRAAGPYSDPVEELLRRHSERVSERMLTSEEAAAVRVVFNS